MEFFHPSIKSLVNHREVGNDTKSFARALKSALREDPDVILVGEMRDYETIGLALTAAETGHLVFGTLHSNNAAKTIDRIIDVFPAAEKGMVRSMLSSSIEGIVAQTLLPKIGGGRVASFEIMLGTNAVRSLIRENMLAQVFSMIQTGARYGMQTMEDSVNDLLAQELISAETARNALKSGAEDADDLPGGDASPKSQSPAALKKGAPPVKGVAGGKAPPPVKEPDKEGYSF